MWEGVLVAHELFSYLGLPLAGSQGPLTPLELQECSGEALLWGHLHLSYTLPSLHQEPDSS